MVKAWLDNRKHRKVDETLLQGKTLAISDQSSIDLDESFKPEEFSFTTTDDISAPQGYKQVVGHQEQLDEIVSALMVASSADHIMVHGKPGIGKSLAVVEITKKIQQEAHKIRTDPGYFVKERKLRLSQRKEKGVMTLDEKILYAGNTWAQPTLIDQIGPYQFEESAIPLARWLPQGMAQEFKQDANDFIRKLTKNNEKINPRTGINEGLISILHDDMTQAAQRISTDRYSCSFKMNLQKTPTGNPKFNIGLIVKHIIKDEDKEKIGEFAKKAYALANEFAQKVNQFPLVDFDKKDYIHEGESELDDKVQQRLKQKKEEINTQNKEFREMRKELLQEYQPQILRLGFKDYKFVLEEEISVYYDEKKDRTVRKIGGGFELYVPPSVSWSSRDRQASPILDAGLKELHFFQQRLHTILEESGYESVIHGDNKSEAKQYLRTIKHKWYEKLGAAAQTFPGLIKQQKLIDDYFDSVLESINDLPNLNDPNPRIQALPERYKIPIITDNSETKGFPLTEIASASVGKLIGTVGHDALNMQPEHLRQVAGEMQKNDQGIVIVDEGIKLLKDTEACDMLLTPLNNGTAPIMGSTQKTQGGSSAHIESEPYQARAKLILCVNHNAQAYLDEMEQFSRRFRHIHLSGYCDNTKENRQQLATKGIVGIVNRFRKEIGENGREEVPPLSRDAVAYLVNDASVRAGDARYLSLQLSYVKRDIEEATVHAYYQGDEITEIRHIDAVRKRRMKKAHKREKDNLVQILKSTNSEISIEGMEIGRINGLVVYTGGDAEYGLPWRKEAAIGKGRGKIRLAEQLTNQAGQSAQKGLTMNQSYLMNNYGKSIINITNLDIQIAAPHSTGGYDGNSASIATLMLIESAVTQLGIDQRKFITGACVGKEGEVGNIGGIYEKVHGAYSATKMLKGLDGSCGVIFPQGNLQELLMYMRYDQELEDAVHQGTFNLYPVTHVSEVRPLLFGKQSDYIQRKFIRDAPQWLGPKK